AMEQIPPEQLAILAKQDQGPFTKSIVITFTAIAFVCFCLRIFTRFKFLGRAVGWEDYTLFISMVNIPRKDLGRELTFVFQVCSIVSAVFQVMQVNAGSGKHAVFVPFPNGVVNILRDLFWSIIFYNIALAITKISILLQYRRIFTVRELRIPLHVVMVICVLLGITTLFTSIFTCVPVSAYWQILKQPSAKCIPDKTLWYTNAGLNITTDLLVAFLPVRVIWKLQISKHQRFALLGILTIGWVVCVVSFLRLHALTVLVAHPQDNSWYGSATAYWSAIEVNLAIVCASLPALKPLVATVIPAFVTRHSHEGYGTDITDKNTLQAFEDRRQTSESRRQTIQNRDRNTVDENIELGGSIITNAYPSTPTESVHGQYIYKSTLFEQHSHENRHFGDNESQKNLVVEPVSVFMRDPERRLYR
ncbi:hypothetical protein EJ02DRAFT_478672, partial [Clathrospora elynae]